MNLFPEIYVKAKGDRLSVSSIGKLKEDLATWKIIKNLREKPKEGIEGELVNLADGTKVTDAEKITYEFSGIEMTPGDFSEIESLIKTSIDICLFDEVESCYMALYRVRASRKKSFESEKSVTFTFNVEKRCTDAEKVTQFKLLNDAYVTGMIVDEISRDPIPDATITCITPSKTGYSVITDSHGEFKVEIPCDTSGTSLIRVTKSSDTKDIILNLLPGDIVEDLEITF